MFYFKLLNFGDTINSLGLFWEFEPTKGKKGSQVDKTFYQNCNFEPIK
jgi:hypothetical protein